MYNPSLNVSWRQNNRGLQVEAFSIEGPIFTYRDSCMGFTGATSQTGHRKTWSRQMKKKVRRTQVHEELGREV